MTYIYGHRGASAHCPENTMAAFVKALACGADGIELDVHLTKDRIPVIIHDDQVKRTTNGKGWVKHLSLDEIKRLDAGSWFSPAFKTEKILTLQEFLEWIAPTSLFLNIELKNNTVEYEGMEALVYNLVQTYEMKERTIYSSFNHYSLVQMKKIDESVETATLYSSALYKPWAYAKSLGASSVHPHYKTLKPAIIQQLKAHGIGIRPYTVNQEKWLTYFFQQNIDAIITDSPDVAHAIRHSC
ncbi:glycerophosphoryl diester phosphodiesterase family protein [Fictibacillus macauensis ZFHKF-1]|uniref:Glycerophosphoryl diester phosphodiesterase family protein n=1 Tax=Fictibacillus macauensis ZFHKF-1 TaxID=1196324 RepID=I8UK85_9BACL|nr:glycerophosphodiester phosphodiesterase [Fictibacillus macauensis]EIT87295.1 glycerophosphoryl diester phosphodiesterase family protein [Fictibacillus macauensis ZFHKF-1]